MLRARLNSWVGTHSFLLCLLVLRIIIQIFDERLPIVASKNVYSSMYIITHAVAASSEGRHTWFQLEQHQHTKPKLWHRYDCQDTVRDADEPSHKPCDPDNNPCDQSNHPCDQNNNPCDTEDRLNKRHERVDPSDDRSLHSQVAPPDSHA